jgi:hypothetical protein
MLQPATYEIAALAPCSNNLGMAAAATEVARPTTAAGFLTVDCGGTEEARTSGETWA